MFFGNVTNPMNDIVDEIEIIKQLGCDFVEIDIEGPYNLPEFLELRKKEIKKALQNFKNPPLAHFDWRVAIGSPNENIRRGWIDEIKKSMLTAKNLGCNKFTVHYTTRLNVEKTQSLDKKELENYVKSLKELQKFSEKIGIKLMLENAAKEGKKFHLKNFAYVADNVPGLKINFDVSHAFLNGGMLTIEEFMNYFSDRIVHVHFSDNFGVNDDHLSIGNGKIDYRKVVEMMKKINYDGTISFEVFEPPRSNVAKSIIKIKRFFS